MKNTLKNNYLGAKSSLNTISAVIISNIGLKNYDEGKILDFVNTNRNALNASPLKELNQTSIKEGIEAQILSSDIDCKHSIT